jgi:hypothetical protein
MADEAFTRKNPLWYGLFQYFHSGLYSEQIRRYLNVFPREQVHVVLFDDLQSDTVETVRRVYAFLGVDPTVTPYAARYNESLFPLSVRFQYLVGRHMDRTGEKGMGPIRTKLFRANARLGKLLPRPFDPGTRARLFDAYRRDIEKTAVLINRPLDTWLEEGDAART